MLRIRYNKTGNDITLRHIHATIFAVEKELVLHIVSVYL